MVLVADRPEVRRRRGLPDHPDEPPVHQSRPVEEDVPGDQRRSRGGEDHHRRQPRRHHGHGRDSDPDGGYRPAPPRPPQGIRGLECGGPHLHLVRTGQV